MSNNDLRRINRTVKKSEGHRANNMIRPAINVSGQQITTVKLLEELVDDAVVDAVRTWFQDGTLEDDDEENKFQVKGWGELGTYPEGTRGMCWLMGDTWIFGIPDVCPESE